MSAGLGLLVLAAVGAIAFVVRVIAVQMSLGRDDRAHPTGTPSQDLTTDLIVMNPCGLDVTDVDAAYSLLAERVAENLHGLPHPSKEQCANAVQDALRACGRADVSAASVRRIVRAVRSRHGL